MHLWHKYSPVNFLHILGTPICKCFSRGLLVGGMVSNNYLLNFFIDQINTAFCQRMFYFSSFS